MCVASGPAPCRQIRPNQRGLPRVRAGAALSTGPAGSEMYPVCYSFVNRNSLDVLGSPNPLDSGALDAGVGYRAAR